MTVSHRDLEVQIRNTKLAAERLGLPPIEFHGGSPTQGRAYGVSGGGREIDGYPYRAGATRMEAAAFLRGMEFALGLARLHAERQRPEAFRKVPEGLCPVKTDHQPHGVDTGSLAPFWCHADQTRRQPFAAEQARAEGQYGG